MRIGIGIWLSRFGRRGTVTPPVSGIGAMAIGSTFVVA